MGYTSDGVMFIEHMGKAGAQIPPAPNHCADFTFVCANQDVKRLSPQKHGWYPLHEPNIAKTQEELHEIMGTLGGAICHCQNIGVQYNTIHGFNHVLKVVAQALKTPTYGADCFNIK